MNNNETVINGLLAAKGYVRVFANWTQAVKAAARLRGDGLNAFPMQSFESMRFLVRVDA